MQNLAQTSARFRLVGVAGARRPLQTPLTPRRSGAAPRGARPTTTGALVGAGVVELAGRSVRSGFCSYPLAAVPRDALERLRGYEETVRSLASREG
ncbi:hypothetical protein B5F79_00410 [Olsenella sp. An285]|nr:hypothetical protein B5F79_00410 [Olsenella sp. An285]